MNLVEELKQKRSTSEKESEAIVDSAKLLMSADVQAERKILSQLGLDTKLVQIENLKGEEIEIKMLTEEYGDTFKLNEIRDLAVRYGLKLRPAKEFQGEIDLELASKTRRFLEKVGDNNQFAMDSRFFILAPIEAFEFKLTPKPIPIPKQVVDPILFYKPDHNRDYYTMVHKWGTDFTYKRRLIGWFTANSTNKEITMFALFILTALLVMPILLVTGSSLVISGTVALLLGSIATILLTQIKLYKYNNESSFNRATAD